MSATGSENGASRDDPVVPGCQAGTPRMRRAHIAHHVRGRLRMVIRKARGDTGYMQRIAERVGKLDTVTAVDARPATGSLVVHYQGEGDTLAGELMKLGVREALYALAPEAEVLAEPLSAELASSQTARLLLTLTRAWDRELRQASGGLLDLRCLLPLAVAGASAATAARAATQPPKPTPLWLTLAMFAFTSFEALHRDSDSDRRVERHQESRTGS